MSKWKIATIVLAVFLLLSLATIGTIIGVFKEGLTKDLICKLAPELSCPVIGTQVGPGEGCIAFPIRGGTTRVEAVAVTQAIPAVGQALTANTSICEKISGNIECINTTYENNLAVVTMSTQRGLVTVGVVVLRP